MQEVLPVPIERKHYYADCKMIANGTKLVFAKLRAAVCWCIDAIFLPHPIQEEIDRRRLQCRGIHGLY